MTKILNKIVRFIVEKIIGKITWYWLFKLFHKGKQFLLTPEEHQAIKEILKNNYCIIVARRETHLSTYGIAIAHFFLTGRWGYWSHVLMNCENNVATDDDFKLVEATGKGVHYSKFDEVFNCDSTALLVPVGFTGEEWVKAIEEMYNEVGAPYDDLFDFTDTSEVSCIEAVYVALSKCPESEAFKELQKMLNKCKKLDPDMLYNCKAFYKLYEVRH